MTMPKLTVWQICCLLSFMPFLWLLIDIGFDNLGSNPIQALHIRLGDWSLRFLCLTLAISPIQKISQWRGMASYRQMLGLWCFFYATLHVLGYIGVDHAWVWPMIGIDILQSSYLWLGLLAYIIILLLALTSSNLSKKWLGKNWKKLHQTIYIASIAAVIHYFWQLKGNMLEPLFYLLIVGLLLLFRVAVRVKDRKLHSYMLPKAVRK